MIEAVFFVAVLIAAGAFVRWYLKSDGRKARIAGERSLTGVAGWLALLCFGLSIAPLLDVQRFIESTNALERQYPGLLALPGYETYKALCWIATGLAAVASFGAAWHLSRRRAWSSVMWAVAGVLASGPVIIVLRDVLIPSVVFGPAEIHEQIWTGIFATSTLSVVWITYLFKSKRVRIRYGTTGLPVK